MLSSVHLFSWAKCIGNFRGKRRKRFWEEDSVGKTLLSNLDDLSSDPWNPSQNPNMVTCICIPGTPMARWDRGQTQENCLDVYEAANPRHTVQRQKRDPASHKIGGEN